MGAEEAQRDSSVRLPSERHAPVRQLLDPPGRVAGDGLDDGRICDEVGLAQGVGSVLLPAVLGVHRGQCGIDPAGRQRSVRILRAPLAHGQHVDTALRKLDRGPQTGATGPDDQDRRGQQPFVGSWCGHVFTLGTTSIMSPMHPFHYLDALGVS